VEQPTTVEEWTEQIKREVAENRVIVYAKGEKNAAMCGFSHRVMEIFDRLGVDYEVRNVFADANIRPALCAFTDWPTTPQVFIDGKFVGGCDIVTELYQSGELQELVKG
jgi:monothiol glutaredoxin